MQVALCARNPNGVAAAVAELGAEDQVIGASVDASDHATLTAWVEEYADRLGGVDVLVSNASALVVSRTRRRAGVATSSEYVRRSCFQQCAYRKQG